MGLYQWLYCTFTRRHFNQNLNFKSFYKAKKFLLILPDSLIRTIDILPGLAGLIKGHQNVAVSLIIPEDQKFIFNSLYSERIQKIFYPGSLKISNAVFKRLKSRLAENDFDILVDLTDKPNRAFAYLARARYRLNLNNHKFFPYYNVVYKTTDLSRIFFLWCKTFPNAVSLFPVNKEQKSAIRKQLGIGRNRPLLFINCKDQDLQTIERVKREWPGACIMFQGQSGLGDERTISVDADSDQVIPLLTMSHAYFGRDDEIGHLARIFQKQIL